MLIIYFSGTGNTKYIANKLREKLDFDDISIFSIEDKVAFDKLLSKDMDIVICYPICGGNMPIIMRNFLRKYDFYFKGKNLYTIVTEAGFSGDGGALAYRYLNDDTITYKASYHVFMPTNVSFGKLFTIKNGNKLINKMKRVDAKIDKIADNINSGRLKKTGSSYFSYILGYHLQRKFFDKMEGNLIKKFKVDNDICIKCKRCISLCPMHNITMDNGVIKGLGNCTLCYRCVHNCPTNAITIIKHENVQYKGVLGGR